VLLSYKSIPEQAFRPDLATRPLRYSATLDGADRLQWATH